MSHFYDVQEIITLLDNYNYISNIIIHIPSSNMPKAPSASTSTSKVAPAPISKSSKSKSKIISPLNAKADIDDIFGAGPSTTKPGAALPANEAGAVSIKKKKKNKKKADDSTNAEAVTAANPSSSTTEQSAQSSVQTVVDPSMTTVKAGSGAVLSKGKSKPAIKAKMDEDEMAFMDSRGTGPRECAEKCRDKDGTDCVLDGKVKQQKKGS